LAAILPLPFRKRPPPGFHDPHPCGLDRLSVGKHALGLGGREPGACDAEDDLKQEAPTAITILPVRHRTVVATATLIAAGKCYAPTPPQATENKSFFCDFPQFSV
jgi:hypothetical protein